MLYEWDKNKKADTNFEVKQSDKNPLRPVIWYLSKQASAGSSIDI